MTTAAPERGPGDRLGGDRLLSDQLLRDRLRGLRMSRGLATILIALLLLFAASVAGLGRSSIGGAALLGMFPFASVLAIAGLGQTLVVQQGGIDLSVPGAISLTVVICTHQADGVNSKLLPAVITALAATIVAGLINGLLVGRLGINPIVATLGMNAVLYAGVFQVSGGVPRSTTTLLANIAGGTAFGIPNAVYFAVGAVIVTTIAVKATVAGRRFEATGANPAAAWATGLRAKGYQSGAYIWAQVLYCLAGVLLAGIVAQPTAYEGDNYLLPSVAVVVLGGTSLLGGRGNLVASAFAALFLSQLEQFVLALGVTFAVQTLVQSAALAIGVALYTINWQIVRRWLAGRLRGPAARPPTRALPPTTPAAS